MKINANEIRVGMLLEYKDDLWQVLKTQHVKPGKGGAFAQVEMKSVNKNTKLNERFRSSQTVEKASLEEIDYNFLEEKTLALFNAGTEYARNKGLILVDTKYEFGKDKNGEILLIDNSKNPKIITTPTRRNVKKTLHVQVNY